jgi:hypothetical protein
MPRARITGRNLGAIMEKYSGNTNEEKPQQPEQQEETEADLLRQILGVLEDIRSHMETIRSNTR